MIQYLYHKDCIVIDFFQKYLSINTAAPSPQYDEAIKLFVAQAKLDGFVTQIIELGNDLNALIITYQGSDETLPSIILNHHMDVVPAPDIAAWLSDPFVPLIKDGYIYGRGTQDMKGVGVAHYFAMRELKLKGFLPKRTIHLVAVPDEECGGYNGAGKLVSLPFFESLRAGYVLDEGLSSGNKARLQIKVSERKPIQIEVISKGEMSHGSRIVCNNAAHQLISFLNRLVLHQEEQKKQLAVSPAGLLISMNITSLQAGIITNGVVALNVVGDTAQATIDIRVPPTMPLAAMHDYLNSLLVEYPSIHYSVKSTVLDRTFNADYNSDLYTSLASSIEQCGFIAEPAYFEGSSDLRFYLEKQLQGFGLTPFTVEENLHGINERISLQDLEQGKDLFCTFLNNFC